MSKLYYIPGVDELNQLIETPASRERTDRNRFIINTIISAISAVAAVAAVVAAVVTVMVYIAG